MDEAKANGDDVTEKMDIGNLELSIRDDDKSNGVADHKPLSVNGLTGQARRSSKGNWTKDEDDLLRAAVQHYGGKMWKEVAKCVPNRTDTQCLHRWQKVLKPDLVKGPWSKEEDSLLIQLVEKQPNDKIKWSEIAAEFSGRIGKQCRERWHNHLDPDINKSAWTIEEERILINAHSAYGNRWSEIAKILPGRTENSVKNHWNCSLGKKIAHFSTNASSLNHPQSISRALPEKGKNYNNLSSNCLHKEIIENGNNENSFCLDLSLGCPGSSSSHPSPSDDSEITEMPLHARDFFNSCSIEPKRYSDTCNNLERQQSTSDWSYTGLCYEPPMHNADMNIFSCSGEFPSTNRSIYVPSRRSTEISPDICISSPQSILRNAAMSYDNVPSIIRKRVRTLEDGGSRKDKPEEARKVDDDRGEANGENIVFCPEIKKSEKSEVIKSVGKCLERAFSDA